MIDATNALLAQLDATAAALREAGENSDWAAVGRCDLVIRELLARRLPEQIAIRSAIARLRKVHQQVLVLARTECDRLGAQIDHVADNREALLAYGQSAHDQI